METAGDFVGGGVELAAGMELGQHHLDGRHPLAVGQIHHVHGNAAAVVDHGNRIVDVDDDFNSLGVAGQSLVDGIIHDLVDEVVQAHFPGRTDIHGRAQANRLEAFQDFDVFAGVTIVIASRGQDRCFGRHRCPIGLCFHTPKY